MMDDADRARLARIEAKLDVLIAALAEDAEDDEEGLLTTLDGDEVGRGRDQDAPL